jgi:glycosyltransferase involved in cell wall biosynthesis
MKNESPQGAMINATQALQPGSGLPDDAAAIAELRRQLVNTEYVVVLQREESRKLKAQQADTLTHVRNIEAQLRIEREDFAAWRRADRLSPWRPLHALGKLEMSAWAAVALLRGKAARQGGYLRLFWRVHALWRSEGWAGLWARLPGSARPSELAQVADASSEYQQWLARYDVLTAEQVEVALLAMAQWPSRPTVSVLMPVYNPPLNWLRRAIESVLEQHYPHWELCIADEASTDPQVRDLLTEFAARDARIKLCLRPDNGHIAAASNSALALAAGDWCCLLDHDDELSPHALLVLARAIVDQPQMALCYSDEDKIDTQGRRFAPYFKPDWNPDLALSYNLFNHLGAFRTDLLRDIGGFRVGYEGSEDYDLVLRAVAKVGHQRVGHIPHVLYHWRTIPGSTALGVAEKPYTLPASVRVVEDYLAAIGVPAKVEESAPGAGTLRVRYDLPERPPLVTILIPTRDGFELLRQCIDSVYARTRYPNFEVLVIDNGSQDPRVLTYLSELAAAKGLRVVRDERPFNYSQLNNDAVRHARGELLCFMNNDIEVIGGDWLDEMVGHAVRPQVGMVGARLWYPDETLQHAGVILGIGGVAGHAHHRLTRKQEGYFSRAQLVQNYSAVTAACSVVRASVFREVQGFNERDLAVAFNDIDLCLRIGEAGYRNVWTPFAELYHHESATRGLEDSPQKLARFAGEMAYMQQRHGGLLLRDPAYNPNLALERQDFTLAYPPRIALAQSAGAAVG